MECRHPDISGIIGIHRIPDEQGWRFSSIRQMGIQAREDQDGGSDSHHPVGHTHLYRRLLQLSHGRFRDAPYRRSQWRDQGKISLSHRLHSSTRLHHLPNLQLGCSSFRFRFWRRERTRPLLQGHPLQFLCLLYHPLHVWYSLVRL